MSKKCYLCGCKTFKIRPGSVRDNKSLEILECENCSLVFLSSNEHVSQEFYEQGLMHNNLDINSWLELTKHDDTRRFEFLKDKVKNKSVLDFGCGNAGFLKKIKKIAKRSCGIELQKDLQNYYEQNEIKVVDNVDKIFEKFDFITLFHVLEHLVSPKVVLSDLAQKLSENGEMIIEIPNSNDILLTVYKNKGFSNFTYWSCHLYLFNEKTIKKLLQDIGLEINYVRHIQRYGAVNHLHWLLLNKPGGHQKWAKFDFKFINKIYEKILAMLKITDTIIISTGKAVSGSDV